MRSISSSHGFSSRMKHGENVRTIAIEMVIVIRADISILLLNSCNVFNETGQQH